MNGFFVACMVLIGGVLFAHNAYNGEHLTESFTIHSPAGFATTTVAYATSTPEFVEVR